MLHCAHALDADDSPFIFKLGTHWIGAEMPFTAPDGEQGVAGWINCCDWCYHSIDGVMERAAEIKVTGHVVWKNDGTCITENFT